MKATIKVSGNDGSKHYEPDDTCTIDSDWLRKMLVNGLAAPADDAAQAIVDNEALVERWSHDALTENALAMGVPESEIPALVAGS